MTYIVKILSLVALAGNGLPKKYDAQDMNLDDITQQGLQLTLQASFEVPKGFKPTEFAQLTVFSKN